jgi:nicotinamidase-related amidase
MRNDQDPQQDPQTGGKQADSGANGSNRTGGRDGSTEGGGSGGMRPATPEADVALLLIDVINDLAFDGGEQLLEQARPMAAAIAMLKTRAHAAGIPVIYVNDNFGHWRSDFPKIVEYCMRPGAPGRETTAQLQPGENDYFVIKPRHSAFYQTSLDLLLKYLKVRKLILTGMAADMCVLFTANDAYLREFEVVVPADCCAAEREPYRQQALELVARALKGDISPSTELDLQAMVRQESA